MWKRGDGKFIVIISSFKGTVSLISNFYAGVALPDSKVP